MKPLAAFALALLVACHAATEPPTDLGALPGTMVGYYKLVSINGQPVPWEIPPTAGFVARDTIIAGGLMVQADSGWTVGDTTRGTAGAILFRWGGKLAPNPVGQTTTWTFSDSLRAGTRYTGTLSGETFTLVSTRTYKYQRMP